MRNDEKRSRTLSHTVITCRVEMMWVPAHEGVSPNSYADAAAKAYLRAGEVEDVTTVVASEVRSRDCLYERRVLRTRVSPARTSVRARDFFAILCRFRPPNAHFSVRTGVSQRRTPSGRGDSAGSPSVGIPTPAHQSSTARFSKLYSKLQQSRHLASSIIAMPSVMFKDIGKACSGALAHASEAVRLKAKSCSVVGRVRALLRRSAQQGLQDWQVDGRAEDEDARGARTRRRHQARWGAARQPQPRFRVRRRSRRMAARTTRAHSPAASSSSTRR
jgi:hypothetical protein